PSRFVPRRPLQSQLLLPPPPGLVFLPSVPSTYGQHPWVIEVEDSTSLFFPFLHNGRTATVDVARSPYFPLVKALLEADSCKGILTHIRSTADTLPALFRSEALARKTSYVPLGVPLPPRPVDQDDDGHVALLFTNSWHQNPQGFFLRGGLDVLEAFAILHRQYPHLRLTLRANLPPLSRRYARLVSENWVRVFGHFLSADEMDALQRRAHLYLLPPARIHLLSLLAAVADRP